MVHGLGGIMWFVRNCWVLNRDCAAAWYTEYGHLFHVGKNVLPLELFLSFWNPKSAGVSRETQWTGWDIQVKQVSQGVAVSVSATMCSTWKNSLVKSGEAWVRLEVLKMRLAEQFWTFWSFSTNCWGIPDKRVTVLKTWQYQGCDKGFGSLNCEDMSNWANSTQLQVGRLTHFINVMVWSGRRTGPRQRSQ